MKIEYPAGKIFNMVFIFLFIGLLSCQQTLHDKTPEEKEREMAVRFHIKSITEFKTNYILGLKETEFPEHLKLFDQDGILTRETEFKSDGSIDFIVTHVYDSQGNPVVTDAINSDSSLLYRISMNFDRNKNRLNKIFILPDGTFKYRNATNYDDQGRMKELKWYWTVGLKAINKYSYEGRKIAEDAEYDPQGKIRYTWVYKYDQQENLTEATQFNPEKLIISKILYEYKTGNLLLKQTNYFGEFMQRMETYDYNNENLLSSKTEYTGSGKISSTYRYQYEFFKQ